MNSHSNDEQTTRRDAAAAALAALRDDVDEARTSAFVLHRMFGGTREPTRIGRFDVVGVAGSGAMGRVYIAYDPELDRTVALKLVRSDGMDDDEVEARRRRLVREAKAIAALSHPNVIAVHEVGQWEADTFIVMEYIPGPSLRAWLSGRTQSPEDVMAVLVAAGQGLSAAHRAGLVHRDFKPENVVIGEGLRSVVLDFGLARSEQSPAGAEHLPAASSPPPETETRTGAVIGTPAYMAPELFEGGAPSARSDQFSFCVTAWEALTGERPFEDGDATRAGNFTRRKTAEPPARARRWLERGFELNPDDRWPTMEGLLEDATNPRGRSGRRSPRIRGIGYQRYDLRSREEACILPGVEEIWEIEAGLAGGEVQRLRP